MRATQLTEVITYYTVLIPFIVQNRNPLTIFNAAALQATATGNSETTA